MCQQRTPFAQSFALISLFYAYFSIKLSDHTRGIWICILGSVVLTPDGLLVRQLSNLANFALIFYLHLVFAIVLSLYMY